MDIEDILRKIIREEVTIPITERLDALLTVMNSKKNESEAATYSMKLPERVSEVLTPVEIQDILKISSGKTYELLSNNPPFRVIKIGSKYLVSTQSFFNWLNEK